VYDKSVRRRRAVLALLVACALILLTAYFGESAGGGLHSLQRGISGVVSPVQEGASRALKPFRDLFGWVGDTFHAKGDLKDVTKERDEWQRRAVSAEGAVAALKQQRGMDDVVGELDLSANRPVTARVIGQSPTLWYSWMKIDKGSSSGIAKDMPVLASDGDDSGTGLIGNVESVGSGWAIVQLITDQGFAVGARTLQSRSPGVVSPKVGNPRDLILKYTSRSDRVEPGETVVTTGTLSSRDDLQSPYPPNLPIGEVSRVDEAGTDAQEVHLTPFVDLRRVDFVQVLTQRVNGNR